MYFLCCSFVFHVTFLEERVSQRGKGSKSTSNINRNLLAQ